MLNMGELSGYFHKFIFVMVVFPQVIHSSAAITFLAFVYVVKTRLSTSIPGSYFYLVKEARAWD